MAPLCCCKRSHRRVSPSSACVQLEHVDERSEHNPGIFKEALFRNQSGLRLHAYYACTVESPRGVIIYHHGIRTHGLFETLCAESPGGRQTCLSGSIAELFLDDGFAVYTYDCEGHGLSEGQGPRAFFQSAWDLSRDLVQFASLVRKERPGLPVFASATSMGGGICVGAAVREPTAFNGLILAAPMVSVERVKGKGTNRILVPIAPRLLGCCPCARKWRLVAFPAAPDENARKTFREDPLTESNAKMMAGPSFAAMTFCIDLVRELENLSTPFLTMHARDDTFTDFASSEMLMAHASAKDKTLLEPPPGSHHALFSDEASREWARTAVRDWLGKRCS
mmetsp:Transcript_32233/g.100086  ORF Transcript_32233/g.100086 Transcript_32233/m.100086 type:complete len:337 (+) Transcript_32233:65-1075(+)